MGDFGLQLEHANHQAEDRLATSGTDGVSEKDLLIMLLYRQQRHNPGYTGRERARLAIIQTGKWAGIAAVLAAVLRVLELAFGGG